MITKIDTFCTETLYTRGGVAKRHRTRGFTPTRTQVVVVIHNNKTGGFMSLPVA